MNVSWELLCPACGEVFNCRNTQYNLNCNSCGLSVKINSSFLDFLTKERRLYFDKFLSSYLSIRHAEGRAFVTSSEYQLLPYVPSQHPLAWQWNIRAKSYLALKKLLCKQIAKGAKILDLGAGNGWLSHNLIKLGYSPFAVDVNIDDHDGIGALKNYDVTIPAIRSEFDSLPFQDSSVDVVIFNASFHYVENDFKTMSAILRILKPGGVIIILDSPVYHSTASGVQMMEELHDNFEEKYGDRSDSLDQIGFLTHKSIEKLASHFNLQMTLQKVWYGWKWALKPWLAKIKRKREPAAFGLYSFFKKEN